MGECIVYLSGSHDEEKELVEVGRLCAYSFRATLVGVILLYVLFMLWMAVWCISLSNINNNTKKILDWLAIGYSLSNVTSMYLILFCTSV